MKEKLNATIDALEIIKGSLIFADADYQKLTDFKKELSHTWKTAQIFRTRTEMEVSVLNDIKHPTPDSKYWQAVREQNVMFQELVMLSYEYRKNKIEIEILKRDILEETDSLKQELLQIEIEKKLFIGKNMECTAGDRLREILEWSAIKKELTPLMKYGVDNVDTHQLEAMRMRYQMEASLVNNGTAIADARNILGLEKTSTRIVTRKKGGNGGIHQIK